MTGFLAGGYMVVMALFRAPVTTYLACGLYYLLPVVAVEHMEMLLTGVPEASNVSKDLGAPPRLLVSGAVLLTLSSLLVLEESVRGQHTKLD